MNKGGGPVSIEEQKEECVVDVHVVIGSRSIDYKEQKCFWT